MKLRYVFGALFALAIVFPSMASAEPPAQIPIQAYLTDSSGVPISGTRNVTVTIYDASSGGNQLYTTTKNNVQFTAGSATIHLGTSNSINLSIFENNKDLWAELEVGGQTLSPRLRIATAPYAASALHAKNADNASQLGGNSASSYKYSAGTGLNLNNQTFSIDPDQTQRRVTGTCGSGKAIHTINKDGSVQCRNVSGGGMTYTGGNAITVDNTNNTISVDSNSIGTDELDGSDLSTRGDIDVKSNGLNIMNDGIQSSEIQDGEVTSSDIADGTITDDDVDSSFTSSEVAFSSGGSLNVPQDEIDAIDIDSGSVGTSELKSSSVGTSELKSSSVGTSELKNDAVTSSEITDGTITGDDIGKYPCDGNTTFQKADFAANGGCPFPDPLNLPTCDEVPVGSTCESDANCSNATTGVNTCGTADVWIRTSW